MLFLNKKNKVHHHLGSKLSKNFIFLITLGNFGTLILTVVLLLYFFSKMKHDQIVKNAFETEHRNQNLPLITQTQQIISCQIQPLFSFLIKISEYTHFIWDKINEYGETEQNNYIQGHSKNPFDDNIEDYLANHLEFGLWSVNSITAIDEADINAKGTRSELFKTTLLNPILKTVFESVNVNEQLIERILIIHPSNELLYQYPLYKDKSFGNSNYRGWCKRKRVFIHITRSSPACLASEKSVHDVQRDSVIT